MAEQQENAVAPQRSPVFTPEPQDFPREQCLSLPCGASVKTHKTDPKPTISRVKVCGSMGWNRFHSGSGTAHGAVWFQYTPFMGYWHRTTQLQNRIGTTRRNARKSSARLAVSGCGTATAINGNMREFSMCGSMSEGSVVPPCISALQMEPHGKRQLMCKSGLVWCVVSAPPAHRRHVELMN